MESGLNGEAKAYLMTAESLRPTARVYRLRADLEEATIEDDNDWFAYEEKRYSEYCSDRIVARNENQGFESMSRLVG